MTVPSESWVERAVDRSAAVQRSRTRIANQVRLMLDAARRLIGDKGDFTTQDLVSEAGVALQTFYRYFASKDELLLAVIGDGETVADVAARFGVSRQTVRAWLARYEAGGLEEAVGSSFDSRRAVMLLLAAFAVLALFLSALGIYGVLAYDVSQRTREIGVRKAIGARSRDITWQFLFEAMTLTGTGGLIGIIVGSATVMLVPVVSSLKAIVPLWAVIVGFTVSVGIGLIFGVWPATKAAKLNPVEALRYE